MGTVYGSVPLRVGTSTNIRVLELILPAIDDEDSDAPIACSLRTVTLADEPIYAALSYIWGDATATAKIR
jgi:hypothetical protein